MLLIKLFLAHIIGDFFLQPKQWVVDKEKRTWRSPYLYLHIALHFLLILLLVGSLRFWLTALLLALSHFIIDLAKLLLQKPETRRRWFFVDQGLHLLLLLAVWGYHNNQFPDYRLLENKKFLIILTAALSLLHPASILIRTVISKWPPKHPPGEDQESLQHAGQLIGFLERLMVFVFILLGKWEGVGFLLAAKSVFRFGDLKDSKDMKLTEYVLIGTLLSFGIALLTGVLTTELLKL